MPLQRYRLDNSHANFLRMTPDPFGEYIRYEDAEMAADGERAQDDQRLHELQCAALAGLAANRGVSTAVDRRPVHLSDLAADSLILARIAQERFLEHLQGVAKGREIRDARKGEGNAS